MGDRVGEVTLLMGQGSTVFNKVVAFPILCLAVVAVQVVGFWEKCTRVRKLAILRGNTAIATLIAQLHPIPMLALQLDGVQRGKEDLRHLLISILILQVLFKTNKIKILSSGHLCIYRNQKSPFAVSI